MRNFYAKDFKIGILGGGQLGRMLIQEAVNFDIRMHVVDPAPDAPCAKIAHEFQVGNFNDFDTVYEFGKNKDLVTIEIENVNVEALKQLEEEGVPVYPQPRVLEIIKDKGLQKNFYQENNIPTSPFVLVSNKSEAMQYLSQGAWMQKMRTGGYDGKGVTPFRNESDLEKAFDVPSVLEKWIPFEKEISVLVARSISGEVKAYPPVEMEFNSEANLVEFLFAPSDISVEISQKATKIAIDLIEKLQMVGLLAVEMFLTKEGNLLVNEIAPRPHNSGHQTIEGNVTSQYEQHLRAICDMPLGNTDQLSPVVMVNILGEKGYCGPVVYQGLDSVLQIAGAFVHLYGKSETKPFRKMGHCTVINTDLETAKTNARRVLELLKVIA